MSDAANARAGLGSTVIAALHLAALGLLLWSEVGIVPKLVFGLSWGLLNFFWLVVLRRPAVSAALSLATIVVLILLSRLKYEIIWMTANFLDLMIVNADTVSFLFAVKPGPFAQDSPRPRACAPVADAHLVDRRLPYPAAHRGDGIGGVRSPRCSASRSPFPRRNGTRS